MPYEMHEVSKGYDERFVMIYHCQLDAIAQEPYALSVFVALMRRANHKDGDRCFPSLMTIAKDAGVSKSTVKRAIETLKERGLVRVTPRKSEQGDAASNLYTILKPSAHAEDSGVPEDQGRFPENPRSVPTDPTVGSEGTPNYTNSNLDEEEQELPPDGGEQDAQPPDATPPAPETPPAKKPLPENGPIQQSVKRFCDVMGIENPVAYKMMLGQAKTLVQAGYTPDDVEAITNWLLVNPWWRERGIDLGTVVKQANKWKAAQNTAQRMPRRQADARGGLVFG